MTLRPMMFPLRKVANAVHKHGTTIEIQIVHIGMRTESPPERPQGEPGEHHQKRYLCTLLRICSHGPRASAADRAKRLRAGH